jgi:hypothetical protein
MKSRPEKGGDPMRRGTWVSVALTVLVMLAAGHVSSLRGIARELLAAKEPLLHMPSLAGLPGEIAGMSGIVVALMAVSLLALAAAIVLTRHRWGRSLRGGGFGRKGEPLFAVARRKRTAQDALRTNLAMSVRGPRARARGSHVIPPQVRLPARQDLPDGTNRRMPTPQPWMPPSAGIDAPASRWGPARSTGSLGYGPCSSPSDPRTVHARGRR